MKKDFENNIKYKSNMQPLDQGDNYVLSKRKQLKCKGTLHIAESTIIAFPGRFPMNREYFPRGIDKLPRIRFVSFLTVILLAT